MHQEEENDGVLMLLVLHWVCSNYCFRYIRSLKCHTEHISIKEKNPAMDFMICASEGAGEL